LYIGFISALPKLPKVMDETPFSVPLIHLMRNPGEFIARLTPTFCQQELIEAGLFTTLRERLYGNLCRASGVSPDDEKRRRPLVEADNSDLPPVELVETYLKGTPFADLLLCTIPFTIPEKTRFEHQWIIAPPGAGKSTLIQYLIQQDLELVAADKASIVVM
jgi:hypothetical protein